MDEFMNNLIVAAAQIEPIAGDLMQNYEKHLEYILKAKEANADLVVFPELSLCGYDIKRQIVNFSLSIKDKLVNGIAEVSDGISVVIGLVERDHAGLLYNSAVVLQNGQVICVHRKINLPNYGKFEEGKVYASGRNIHIFDLKTQWKAGLLICADAWNPTLVNLAAIKGATILIFPINSATDTFNHNHFSNSEGWHLVAQFYSFIYGLPIVMANRVGREGEYSFWGGSKIYNSDGRVVQEAAGKETLIIGELDYKKIIESRVALPTVRDTNIDLIHREIVRMVDATHHFSI